MERTRSHADGLIFLSLGILFFLSLGFSILRGPTDLLQDFKIVYYSTRCLLQWHDPYLPPNVLRVYAAENGVNAADDAVARQAEVITYTVYFPSMFVVIAPFALLPWSMAHVAWDVLTALSLILAAVSVWRRFCSETSAFSGLLAGLLLANLFPLLWVGNAAGLAVGLGIAGVLCFLEERFTLWGTILLTAALMLKPHDLWLIWGFLLLSNRSSRRHALRVLAVVLALSAVAASWVWLVAPHWTEELHKNLLVVSGPAALAVGALTAGMIVDLQSAFSVFMENTRLVDAASYLLGGGLIAVWARLVVKAPRTRTGDALALAAAAVLTPLPNYHRVWDLSLLLLSVPAAALLWQRGGAARWLSGLLNGAAVLLTSPFVLTALVSFAERLRLTTATLSNKLLMLMLERPIPLVLLALSGLYLWALAREGRTEEVPIPAA
ncbi:MAG TPA: glycosyltransferase 87 family protein [Terracidiphilus sp.]|nr:glycosyltransferase 87 family protein [Terracidiphilus sp.]